VLLRGYTWLVGGSSEVSLRSFALLAVLLALLGLYAGLRTVYAPAISLAGVLAVWGHGLVVHHAFEARFYGPWLAASVWFAYLLVRSRSVEHMIRCNVLLGACSIFLCLIHYFGILTMGLITAFEAFGPRRDWSNRKGNIVAILAGPVALAGCIPLLLSQRSAFTVPTWVKPPSLSEIAELVTWILLPASLCAVLILSWLSTLFQRLRTPRAEQPGSTGDPSNLAGLTGLLFLPVVLIVLSFMLQPVFVDRYALCAVAGLAPAVAFLVHRMGRGWALALIVFFLLVSTQQLAKQAAEARQRDQGTEETIASIRQHRHGDSVVCEHLTCQYALHHYAPEFGSDCLFIDHERGETSCSQNDYFFCRDLGRRYAAFYNEPKLARWEALRQNCRRFLLVVGVPWSKSQHLSFLRSYPGFTAHRLAHGLYELVAEPSGSVE
jgi:hypothetical protein